MNFLVVVPILVIMAILQWRRVGMLTWLFFWWLGLFCLIKFGFNTPVPQSVVNLYMGIVSFSLLLYITADSTRQRAVTEPLKAFITQKKYFLGLLLVIILIPSLFAARIYLDSTAPVQAPFFGRTVHPSPPALITVHETEYDLAVGQNPLRSLETSDPEQFRRHVENGRVVYYQNCHFCHGDDLAGSGVYARGLNPIPTNFQDPGTIAQLQEAYLFWRIAKGAPGLPEEGGPWESAMPVWENFLTDEEMWEVVLFLYDFTGHRPRANLEVE